MISAHDAEIIIQTKYCDSYRSGSVVTGRKSTGHDVRWKMRLISESLDSNIGWPRTSAVVIRRKFRRENSIACETESVDDIRTQQVRITDGQPLRAAVVTSPGRRRIAEQVVGDIERSARIDGIQHIPAEYRVLVAHLIVDSCNQIMIIFWSRH